MKVLKMIFRNLGTRVWFIVTASVMAFLITVTLVATQWTFLANTLNAVLGEARMVSTGKGNASDYQYYKSDYENKAATLAAADAFNEEIAEEGFILLKNDNSLPLAEGAAISVFGKNADNLVYGGSGSSSGSDASRKGLPIYQGLESAGFKINDTLKKFYETSSQSGSGRPTSPDIGSRLIGFPTGETPWESYTTVKESFQDYNDAALVVISRIGGEGYDLPRTMRQYGKDYNVSTSAAWSSTTVLSGARNWDDHYLQLDANEARLLKEVGEEFDNVIVVINSSQPMELGFLDDDNHYAYHRNIKGAIWIGSPGKTGIYALGRILTGEVNPSGRTVDTFPRDFKKDPTWNNFGDNRKYAGDGYTVGGARVDSTAFYTVEYEEGIYVGYRYWETRGFMEGQTSYATDGSTAKPHINGTSTTNWDNWHNAHVVFPLGYGLSYTDFKWEITEPNNGTALEKDGEIQIKVKVTNNGDRAGKDVVQLYYSAPYTPGKIEKAHVVLGDFAKTKELNKNESDIVTLKLKVRDMASYDYSDLNGNGFKGWELDAGNNYTLYVGENAHHACSNGYAGLSRVYSVPSGGFQYVEDSATGNDVKNLFDDVSDHIKKYLSRNDWIGTWPTVLTSAELDVNMEFINSLKYTVNDKKTDPWYTEEMPNTNTGRKNGVQLYELMDKDYADNLWNALLDQLTVSEMISVIGYGNYNTAQIGSIGKPRTMDPDGPAGFVLFMSLEIGEQPVYNTCFYASECVIAATWNKEIAYGMGRMIGNEGLAGNERGDKRPYSGWYAPAVNIHRSQFSGRNWEYYSEDGRLSGIMAAEVCKGADSKGVYTYVKHFALNDQETNRDAKGLLTWANEQSMREIYFRPFELAVKDGGTTAIMSSFNRIGTVWAGGDYRLLTQLLRVEWGFRGMVVTDYNLMSKNNLEIGYMSPDLMIRAGGDVNLSQDGPPSKTKKDLTATQVACLRNAMKNILYTVVKSNAMNGIGSGSGQKYLLPYWQIALICVDCAAAAGFGVWGFFAIRKARRNKKAKASNN